MVLEELENKAHGASPATLKGNLESLPQDLGGFYAHMLESHLLAKGAEMHASALTMLQWVTYASRPLSLLELSEAVAVVESDSRGISLDMLKE